MLNKKRHEWVHTNRVTLKEVLFVKFSLASLCYSLKKVNVYNFYSFEYEMHNNKNRQKKYIYHTYIIPRALCVLILYASGNHRTHRMETKFWRWLANYERDSKYYQKVLLSLSDSFCFVYLYFVNFRHGFLFSILVEIDDIFCRIIE